MSTVIKFFNLEIKKEFLSETAYFLFMFFNCKYMAAKNTMTMSTVGASTVIHAKEPALLLISTLHSQYKRQRTEESKCLSTVLKIV